MRFGWALLLMIAVAGCTPATADRRYPDRELVRLWHPWTAEWDGVVHRIADRFNASQSRYEVVPLSVPGSDAAATKFMLGVSGGAPPDLVASWSPVLPLWARDGIVRPLDPFLSPADRAAFGRQYGVSRRASGFRGKLYGLCVGLNVQAIYYRPAELRAAGLPDRDPQSLDELARWGDRLDRRRADGTLERLGLLPAGLRDHGPAFGGGYEGGRIDTPGNHAALEWETRQHRKVGFAQYERFEAGLGKEGSVGGWPFISGRFALAVNGQWRVEEIAKAAPEIAREYRVAPLPPVEKEGKRTGYAAPTLLMVPATARHPEGAWAFARFWSGLADPKVAAELNVAGGWLPNGPEMAAAPAYREYVRRYPQFGTFMRVVAEPGLQTLPSVADVAYLFDAAVKQELLATSGKKTPRQALQDAQRDFDKERARREALGERF